MSDPRTSEERTAPVARERKKFENWMRRYWGGIDLCTRYVLRNKFEYKETAAQTAWEVWCRFAKVKV